MGHVWVDAEFSNPKTGGCVQVKALVDAGATYTVIPAKVARELGLESLGYVDVKTACGVERLWESEAKVRMFGRERTSPVLVSEKVDFPLVGVVTLEILRLRVDPTTGKAEELPLFLYTSTSSCQAPR
jgi:clan AA aspartic protease